MINVSSYKNVDAPALLKIDGVTYVPLVGKCTVAMLERNLIKLVNTYHLPAWQQRQQRQQEQKQKEVTAAAAITAGMAGASGLPGAIGHGFAS